MIPLCLFFETQVAYFLAIRILLIGAQGGIRTRIIFLLADFESAV